MYGADLNIVPKNFNCTIDGQSVGLYSISNKNGLHAHFTNYGQHLVALYVPDRYGDFKDIVLGFPTLETYMTDEGKYFGSIIGRYANRIAKGKFFLNGSPYNLAVNNGTNHLHGGDIGFDSVVWQVEQINWDCLEFSRTSPNGEEGYPGCLEVRVRYILTNTNTLSISYTAKTDQTTLVNLTNHSFFNLNGEGQDNIKDHLLNINARSYTPIQTDMAPTGTVERLEGTPMDFSKFKTIGKDLESDHPQMAICSGYDHNYILDKDGPKNNPQLAATVFEPKSGRVMEVHTTEPGMQLYTSNFLDGTLVGKSGKPYLKHDAFCLETQHFPDSPNQPEFPSTILHPGETYTSVTEYRFWVR